MDIVFSEKLYREGISERKLKRIKKKVKQGKVKLNLFFVALPLNDNGLLEVYWYPELLQTAYREFYGRMTVVGIAKNREDAFACIEKIVTDVGWQSGNIPIATYFKEHR